MIAYVDASAGVSGDMLLGAIVDLGVDLGQLQAGLDQLGLPIRLSHTTVTRGAMRASKVDVEVADTATHRHLDDIRSLLNPLSARVREQAVAVFELLARAEGRIHGLSPDAVHFHEVGALDAIADIVGVALGLEALGSPTIHSSAVGLGSGHVEAQHGTIPVPVPAVLELLRGAPVHGGPANFESATPTGAAILAAMSAEWGPVPPMEVAATGVGAGSREPEGWPNVVRVILGDPTGGTRTPRAWQLDSNVDDMDPRLWPEAQRRLLQAGASDAWLTPILMKKGRPAHALSVLCSEEHLESVRSTIYRETTTIGVRMIEIAKHALDREQRQVLVDGEPVSVKVSLLGGRVVNVSVEWEDVLRAATSLGRPVKLVLDDAKALASSHMAQTTQG